MIVRVRGAAVNIIGSRDQELPVLDEPALQGPIRTHPETYTRFIRIEGIVASAKQRNNNQAGFCQREARHPAQELEASAAVRLGKHTGLAFTFYSLTPPPRSECLCRLSTKSLSYYSNT